MNIILFTTVHGRPGSLNLGRPQFYLPLLAMVTVVCALVAYAGYRVGMAGAGRPAPAVALHDWRADMESQRRAVEQARRSSQAHLDALTLRLAQMQAQVMRLDGIGQRLVEIAKLDKGEFNFEQPPAQGGPVEAGAAHAYEPPDFMRELDALSAQLDDREQQLIILEDLLLSRTLKEQGYPAGRPVTSGWLSSYFGKRTDPFTGRPALHAGVDFAGKLGSDIVAVAAGVVIWSGKRHGYGNLIEINHGNGYVTRYAHNQKNLVKVGETVKKGQKIALMGSSGRSTGPHVHYEVLRDGRQVDPARYLTAAR
ncbi:MAG: M23 family metallopeptidase [Gammaproteobacteria bacterium]|jgi:murein DD-endopeptidase MepM/ murein hydrolase activator NlpD|nr:M23 family metallopeptidase [Gammaproteobacteria bacterium]